MGDFSDDSDINPEEIVKTVEDIDDLDNNLLRSSFRAKNLIKLDNKASTILNTKDSKKKVAFKDYNEDDPLADLMSDEDEVPQKHENVILQNAKSTLMQDLFGLKASTTSIPNVGSSNKSINLASDIKVDINKNSDEPLSTLSNKMQLKEDTLRIENISHINENNAIASVDKHEVVSTKSQKSLLMEDLFGSRPRAVSSKEINPQKDISKTVTKQAVKRPIADFSKDDQAVKSLNVGYAPTISAPREPRRGRRGLPVAYDPLGLLSSPPSEQPLKPKADINVSNQELNRNETTSHNLPEWLDESSKFDTIKSSNIEETYSSNIKLNRKDQSQTTEDTFSTKEKLSTEQKDTEHALSYPKEIPILLNTQFDQHAAIIAMQQQENELRTATTLANQNEQLNKLFTMQRFKLTEQEKQFNMLIKKQLERQILIETQIKSQQDRIDQYIQALMAQPTSLSLPILPSMSKSPENIDETTNNKKQNKEAELQQAIEKLEMEKTCTEVRMRNMKERHEHEMMTYENSYKRQIVILENTVEELEKRFHSKLKALEADYELKIEKLKIEKIEMESAYKAEIDTLKNEHLQFVHEICDRHSVNMKLLQKEHSETLENISKAKECENLAVSSVAALKNDMSHMLQKANCIMSGIKITQEKLKEKDDKIEKSRENYLKIQEEKLEAQMQDLRRQTKILETERKQILEVVQRLEPQFTQLITEIQRKATLYNEIEVRLKTKEEALIKERKLFEEKVMWEHKQLENLKDMWIKEQERQLRTLAQEKEAVGIEKAKLEVSNRLKVDNEDIAKAELEATIKAAQDANNRANQERLRWQEKLNQLEVQQHNVHEKEKELILRAKELEKLTQSALAKKDEGTKALKQARHIEDQHKERLSQLQIQLEALAQRENKIATEKLSLARERLALRATEIDKPEKDVKVTVHSTYVDNPSVISEIRPTSQITQSYMDIVDPQLVMFKLNLDNQLDLSNKYLATMGI